METTESKAAQIPEVKVYVEFYCELYTSNSVNAAMAGGAATKAIARFTQEINMPLEYSNMRTQQEDCGTFKTVIEAETEGKKPFSDYKQEYSWRDAVRRVGDKLFTRWKLKSYLLMHPSKSYSGAPTNRLSFSLRKTAGSDISGCNFYL